MNSGETKTYIYPPLPQAQVPTVVEVSPQPQNMKEFSKTLPRGVKKYVKNMRRIKPSFSIKYLQIQYSGGTITPFFRKD